MNNHFRNSTMNNVISAAFRPSLFARLRAAVAGWHNRRIAALQLHAMPDALLRDIGIERHQINAAVRNFGASPAPLKLRPPPATAAGVQTATERKAA